jgi:hypothetical protein
VIERSWGVYIVQLVGDIAAVAFLVCNGHRTELTATPDAAALARAASDGRGYFVVERSPEEYLEVVYTDRGSAVIHVDRRSGYLACNASTESRYSAERFVVTIGGQMTPLPLNQKLTKAQVRNIVAAFVEGGTLLPEIHWLPDGPPA